MILSQSQVLDSNSQYGADDNHHFTMKESEKARLMGLLTIAVAICAGQKADHYYQNNNRSIESLSIGLNQWIV